MKPQSNGEANPVKTLIVDDAPMMRKVIGQILAKDPRIQVVGTAANGQECLNKIRETKPEVITLDIDMPVMNGITTVKNIMVRHQIPVVIISSLVQDGYFAFESLRLGVVDFLPKPSRVQIGNWDEEEDLVRMRVLAASGMRVHRMRRVRRRRMDRGSCRNGSSPGAVVVMGTTLAGPNTIMHIVTRMAPTFQGAIVALQEIHPKILVPFCSYFNRISPLEVLPVLDSTPLEAGRVFLGSTFRGIHLEKDREATGKLVLQVDRSGEEPINGLFRSASRCLEDRVCGVLLTGVGEDGSRGMGEIREGGGLTIAQEQDCCVYPNLVEHALRENVVDLVISSEGIAARLQAWVEDKCPVS